jgi:hypothetical protein
MVIFIRPLLNDGWFVDGGCCRSKAVEIKCRKMLWARTAL